MGQDPIAWIIFEKDGKAYKFSNRVMFEDGYTDSGDIVQIPEVSAVADSNKQPSRPSLAILPPTLHNSQRHRSDNSERFRQ